jgi:transposase
MGGTMFGDLGEPVAAISERRPGAPRLLRANRRQVLLRPVDLERLLPEGHRARAVWDFVAGLDLSTLLEEIRAVAGHPGRPAIDPAILLSVWLYATTEGVGSARAIERLSEEHDAYRWICGGVSVNYHTRSDFRVGHPEVLDRLLAESVAALPAFNAQLATDTETQVIVGVGVTNAGSDARELPPMVDQISDRCGKVPKEVLVDGGFATLESVEAVSDRTTVYAPVMEPKDKNRDPHQPMPNDTGAIGAWRVRMGTEAAQQIYKERAATAECVNALARNRGLRQIPVRGTAKALAVILLFALAHNMMRAITLLAG